MAESKYTAGLQFIVSTPAQTLDKHDRKAIRSHATRARATRPRKHAVQLWSWISPNRELGSLRNAAAEEAPIQESMVANAPSPRQFGSHFSGLQLPSGVEPHMIQDLVKLINLNKQAGYPHEVCVDAHPVERGWFPYMVSDLCCLHSMMFSLRAIVDRAPRDHLACFHYAKTLQLLQARLNEHDQTSALCDSTIMVVITLAISAELTKDFDAVETHIRGLEKIVGLRGGVRALTTHNNMQVKVCRADLAYALQFGHQPLLFKEGISWDCFIADSGLVKCSHRPHDANIRAFTETALDARLHNAMRDLHAFSCMSNVAYQTKGKLSANTYNEMMISILYRLAHLSFEHDPLQEALRLGLVALSSQIYLQRHYMEESYDFLLDLFNHALLRLRELAAIDLPVPVILWLTMLSHVVARNEPTAADWRSLWLDQTILRADINSWSQACEMLRSIAWVDFIHKQRGKPVFEAAISRLNNINI
ncbi:uncharacterized protein PAC_03297 [Phialocephala subalpina]|uniref:Uncharacterized protein n=1 Tax=Phialocephala subalpina TaxID=576137 RepID=A0A1L7WKX5_9HELO|nr:uncharacterized protein PAC_03297 [Phialocephala subalpina]